MRDFTLLNIFFNIVFRNESAYKRLLLSSYDLYQEFLLWLDKHHIVNDKMKLIDQNYHTIMNKDFKNASIESIFYNCKDEFEQIASYYEDKLFLVYLPRYNETSRYIDFYDEYVQFFSIQDSISDLSFDDPFSHFMEALIHVDSWPGVLIFNKSQSVFKQVLSDEDLNDVLKDIREKKDIFTLYKNIEHDSYAVQLSDLHLGPKKSDKGLVRMFLSLDYLIPYLKSQHKIKFLITGDLMQSPNRTNMYIANDLMINLKKAYKADVTFILGNHDVIVHGFNMFRTQKSKVIAYLLGENIKVIEDEKLILIKLDSNSEGNLARGKVRNRQLEEIDEELAAIDHLEDYTLIVMIHHHLHSISKADFIKVHLHEKFIWGHLIEKSKILIDADILLDWIHKHKIQYVFHGHKHIPFFKKDNGCYFIAAGSATGSLKEHVSKYISYNLVKYDLKNKEMKYCMIIYADTERTERFRVEINMF